MKFTRLRLSGFKSFPDPTEVAIEEGLTGIVGPNGCGKSNIVEALRWVTGESSARGVRGSEMDDVIFNGSSLRPRFDFAEVTLTLEGPVEGHVEAGAELRVSRRIGRGAGSVYRIAGREARARDVQLLFADAGSGARSAAFVNQGQVTAIVDARPDERRRLLEEAAGIGGLHARRREAELRLAATERNLALVVERLAEQERQLAVLARQQRQAERFRRLQGELRRLEKLRLLARLESLRGEMADRRTAFAAEERRHAAVTAELEVARRNREDLERALRAAEQARASLAASRVRAEERLRSRRLAIERERGERLRLERRIAELEGEIASLCDRLREGERRAGELQSRETELEAEAERLKLRLEQERERLAVAERELAAVEDRLRGTLAEEGRILADLEAAERASEELRNRRGTLEARLADTERELAAVATGEPAAELAARESERGKLRSRLAEQEAAVAEIRERLSALERELAEAEARGAALAAEGDRLRALAREREAALEAVRERRRLLEEALAAAAERGVRLRRERDELEARRIQPAIARLAQELEEVRAAREAIEDRIRELENGRAGLVARRQEAAAERAASEQQRMRLESEIAALEGLLPAAAPDPLIDRLDPDAEETRALMAALGEELLLGTDRSAPAHWREASAGARNGADPPLPEGVEPLAARIAGTPALARRLAMTGLVEAERAERLHPRLAPGQVLVSRDGGIWRWDGLVRGARASAEVIARLDRRRRLGRLRRLLVERRRREEAAATTLAGIEAELAALEAEAAELADRRRALERREDILRHRRDTLRRDGETVARRLAGIDEEMAALDAEAAGLRERRRELDAEAARLVADREEEEALAALEARRTAAAQAVARLGRAVAEKGEELGRLVTGLEELRRREAALERDLAERRQRLAALGERSAALRATVETVRGELAALEETTAAARLRVERLRGLRQEVEARRSELETARLALREARDAARERCEAAGVRLTALDKERSLVAGERTHLESLREDLEQRLAQLGGALEASRNERRLMAAPGADTSVGELEAELARLARELTAEEEERQRLERALRCCREKVEALAATAGDLRERRAALQGDLARLEGEAEAVEREIRERLGRPAREFLADPEIREALAEVSPAEIEPRIEKLRLARERLGEVNLRAAREHAELEEAVAGTRAEEAELRAAVERLRGAIATLDREGRRRLLAVFETVDRHFKLLFRRLFGGGEAHLRLTRLDEPFAAGLELEAMPPGKKLQHVSLLSGGEKSLAALALVFAFFLARPSPLCVLDEVDAALDDANVERFLAMMSEIAAQTETRFLVVTHHPLTMARMDRLYGVTMTEPGVSRLVSVVLETAVALRATA